MTRSVLIVEDNELNRRLFCHVLTRAGYRVIEAADGETGVALVTSERPSLVVLDMELPEIPGTEVIRRIREQESVAQTPILVVSALVSESLASHAQALGCSGFLQKPVAPRALVAAVDRAVCRPEPTA